MFNRIDPAAHGALDFSELEQLGISPDEVLDFSVNSNPFGAPPGVWDAIQKTKLERYPDREAIALRRAISDGLGVSMDQIVVGNGAAELIQLIPLAFLRPGEKVLIVGPTFGEYERSARLVGADPYFWRSDLRMDFTVQPEEIQKILDEQAFRLVFLCTPNNPTGAVFPVETLKTWAEKYPQTIFMVDEAYLAFVPGMKTTLDALRKNIIVLRSMTKDYALAGLRLGYAVADEEMIRTLASLRPPWNVNAIAQAAGLAALQDGEYLTKTMNAIQDAKADLVKGLKSLGFNPHPSQTHFFLIPVGNGAVFRRRLLQAGIQVRDCASFGLPEHVRVSTRLPDENDRLLDAIKKEFV